LAEESVNVWTLKKNDAVYDFLERLCVENKYLKEKIDKLERKIDRHISKFDAHQEPIQIP